MATFTGTQIRNTYDAILKLEDNDQLTASKKKITDGVGNETPLSVSTTEVTSTVNLEATGFQTPAGTSSQFLMADGSVSTGGSSDLTYNHNQGTSSASWSINHSLGKFPSVMVVDTAGSVVTGTITYTDLNNITINFNSAFSGDAYLN